MKREKGLFIVVDGNEACGKTSAIAILDKYIKGKNQTCVSTRAIGHGDLGEKLRHLLLIENDSHTAFEELMICLTAVTNAINSFVCPNVVKGNNVILDRYFTSTLVYQAQEKFHLGKIDKFQYNDICTIIHRLVANTRKPDITILISSDLETTKQRIKTRQDLNRLDIMSDDVFETRNASFIEAFSVLGGLSDRYFVLNSASYEEFEKKLIAIVKSYM